MVRGHRGELGSRRQQRGKVKNQVDLELGKDPFQQAGVEYRPRKLAMNQMRDLGVEWVDVERYDALVAFLGEIGYESVSDFAVAPVIKTTGFRTGLVYVRTRHGIPSRFQMHRRL